MCLSVAPFIFLLGLNLLIFMEIRRKTREATVIPISCRRQQRDVSVATILVIIVMLYAVCHSIKLLVNCMELLSIIIGNKSRFYGKTTNYGQI